MSALVGRLEALLTRVQKRASAPRPLQTATLPSDDDAADDLEATTEVAISLPEIDEVGEFDEGIDDVPEIVDVELDEVDVPISGPVSAVEPTMDEAMDAAEHQSPLTPPPEAGEELTRPHIPAKDGPTMEQLGETIALEEGGPQNLELDEPTLDEPTLSEPPSSHREAELPASRAPDDLTLPENAREELERVRLGDSAPLEARVSSRPVISTNVVDLVSSARNFAPTTFLDLLEASLKLK
jgi:hypothetical protein